MADGPRGRGVGMLLRGGLRAIHELLLLLLPPSRDPRLPNYPYIY